MQLNDLLTILKNFEGLASINLLESDINIKELTLDSRTVAEGVLFFAIKGTHADGRNYIDNAIKNGANAVFATSETYELKWIGDIPVFYIPLLEKKVSAIAGYFYQNSVSDMKLIGITGTNGKTTTTHLIAMWLKLLNQLSSVMGTVGNGIFGQLVPSDNTTASAIDVQKNLAKFFHSGASVCAMEVSSHGLDQFRVEGLSFDAVAFLNLSRDHLDYHGSMENYEAAKWRLFSDIESKNKIINIDDPVGFRWQALLENSVAISVDVTKQQGSQAKRYVFAKEIIYHPQGVQITIDSSFGSCVIDSKLLGAFNVTNLLTALATLLTLGYDFSELISVADQLKPVAGRMEVFAKINCPTVVVDYAHTPDALEKALDALKIHQTGRLWCVFGCGGDRDRGKRPIMGAVAESHADKVVITDDNPRTEDNQLITHDIVSGMTNLNHIVINDRIEAIKYAIMQADATDIILVAGKGHEDYQIIGHTKHDYSDRLLMKQLYQTDVRLA